MTFLHFLNCALLTYAPTVVVDRSTVVADESRVRLYMWCLIVYIGCQLAKMVLATTFLPLPPADAGFVLTRELALALLSVVDVFGVVASLKRARFASRWANILGVSIAWALADAALSKFMPLWFSARGTEFTWANAQMGLDANIKLLSFLAFTALAWVWSFGRRTHPLTHVGLGMVLLIPAAKGYAMAGLGLDSWGGLAVQLGLTLASGVVARVVYTSVTTRRQ